MSKGRTICLVCGFTDDEVDRMHSFPSNLARSKIWQQNMHMVVSSVSLKNYKICSRNFKLECYSGMKLDRTAVPTLFPCQKLSTNAQSKETVVGGNTEDAAGERIEMNQPSTS